MAAVVIRKMAKAAIDNLSPAALLGPYTIPDDTPGRAEWDASCDVAEWDDDFLSVTRIGQCAAPKMTFKAL
jgi:hypothetical protein